MLAPVVVFAHVPPLVNGLSHDRRATAAYAAASPPVQDERERKG